MKTLNLFTASLFALVLIIAGCDTAPQSETGTLEVRLVDAPIDSVSEVNIVIDSVQVNNTDNEEGWITISEPMQSYDLLKLTNGAYEVLGEVDLEPGTYEQIRLILNPEGNNLVFPDERVEDLFIPSGAQTGVKLNVNAEIEAGFTYTLILDFDASRSVVKAGNSGKYLLKPVIKASNEATTGIVSGTVLPADAKSKVMAIVEEDTLTTTLADTTDGTYKLLGLDPGTYRISFEPRVDGYAGTDTTGVEVTAGATTELGTTELEEN